jgi:urease accessory protein
LTDLASSTRLDLGFVRRGGRTVLDRRVFRWPYVLTRTFSLDPVPAHMLTVIVQSSSGAINEDDCLEQRLHLAPGAAVHFATQGATVVHRARQGMAARESISLSVAESAMLEYLPEPRILFPDSELHQQIDVDCDPGGTAIVADGFTFHDPTGADRRFGRTTSETRIRVGGETVMIDRFDISGTARLNMKAFSSLIAVTRQAIDATDLSRRLSETEGLYAAAGSLPGGAGTAIRFAARDLRLLRAGANAAWKYLRIQITGAPPPDRQSGNGVPYFSMS